MNTDSGLDAFVVRMTGATDAQMDEIIRQDAIEQTDALRSAERSCTNLSDLIGRLSQAIETGVDPAGVLASAREEIDADTRARLVRRRNELREQRNRTLLDLRIVESSLSAVERSIEALVA